MQPVTGNLKMATGNLYFYHPDHLGTGTFLTDANGLPYEFFLNLPFGETMVEQHSLTEDYENLWKFTGHELDKETGMYYAGARYYNPKWSVWLSVDPLAEEFPEWTPYHYVHNNPINLIDPDGMSAYGVNSPPDYFDKETGEYLGEGGTDEIRFISREDWNNGCWENYTTSGNSVDDDVAKNMMQYYSNFTDLKIKFDYKFKIVDSGMTTDYKDDIVIAQLDKSEIGNTIINRYDAINFHEHETYSHGRQWRKYKEYNRDKDFWKWEKEATIYQINTSSWEKTSLRWKALIYQAYGKYDWIVPAKSQPKYFPGININPK